jgi:hypothetical protein
MPHKTMQGREIDMEKLARLHELTPAVGNAKVNARGDQLGPGGKIVKKREEVLAEYYETNPKALSKTQQPAPVVETSVVAEPATTVSAAKSKKSSAEE